MSLYRDFLLSFGWDDFFEQQFQRHNNRELIPARVIGEEKNLYRVQYDRGKAVWAAISGKFRFETDDRENLPAVGDWVLCHITGTDDRAVIHHILNRKSCLKRKQAGTNLGAQVLASNIDTFFVASSLNDDLNPRRLERYLTVGWDAGVEPILLLTKSDLADSAEELTAEIEAQFPMVRVFAVSVEEPDSILQLQEFFKPGKTSVIVGSSGVGKSTLINFLVGEEVMVTQSIREDDAKGRHTTTARHLLISRWGGLVIDTPGMRELQLMDHEEGLQQSFGDVEELFLHCRFSNCEHRTEPDCAVHAAIENGSLTSERWESYLKLLREIRHFQRKNDKAIASQDRNEWKKRHKAQRAHYRNKKGGG